MSPHPAPAHFLQARADDIRVSRPLGGVRTLSHGHPPGRPSAAHLARAARHGLARTGPPGRAHATGAVTHGNGVIASSHRRHPLLLSSSAATTPSTPSSIASPAPAAFPKSRPSSSPSRRKPAPPVSPSSPPPACSTTPSSPSTNPLPRRLPHRPHRVLPQRPPSVLINSHLSSSRRRVAHLSRRLSIASDKVSYGILVKSCCPLATQRTSSSSSRRWREEVEVTTVAGRTSSRQGIVFIRAVPESSLAHLIPSSIDCVGFKTTKS